MTAVSHPRTGPAGLAGLAGALAVVTFAGLALLAGSGSSSAVAPSPSPLPGAPHGVSQANGVVLYGRYLPHPRAESFTRGLVITAANGGPPRVLYTAVSCCASLGGHRVLLTVAPRSGTRDVVVDTRANRTARRTLAIPGMVLGPGVLSPDGSRIAVWASLQERGRRGAVEVHAGGAWHRIGRLQAGPLRPLAFSPDGTRLLVYHPLSSRDGTVGILTIATGRVNRLTPPGMSSWCCYFGSPASWSPDGRVAFAAFQHRPAGGDATQNGVSAVFVTQPGGDAVRRVTDWGEWTTSAHWSPDTRLIAYDTVNERAGAHDLFVIDPDGGSPSLVATPDDGGSCCAVWTPNGKALVYESGANDNHMNLWAANLDGTGTFHLTSDASRDLAYAVTPVP
jgi:hypothetical protein